MVWCLIKYRDNFTFSFTIVIIVYIKPFNL
jgi:hypothetical protein